MNNSKEISTRITLLFDDSRYLEVEWEVKRKTHREFSKTNMVDLCPKVPKQDNSSDCGVYLLQYVESFFKVCKDSLFTVPSMRSQITGQTKKQNITGDQERKKLIKSHIIQILELFNG